MDYKITINAPHLTELKNYLRPNDGHEGGALMLFGVADIEEEPWTGKQVRKYVSHMVVPIRSQDIVSTSPHNFLWRKSTFVKLLRKAKTLGMCVAFVHSHRGRIDAYFSEHDDENDAAIAELANNCTKGSVDLLSIVLDDNDRVVARKCCSKNGTTEIASIVLLDENRWIVKSSSEMINTGPFDRQVLAFGDGFLDSLSRLRIVIVGAGATGSATAMMLARHGVQTLGLVDLDYVDLTNISRLHGATVEDAEAKKLKVDVLKREIERIGLGTHVETFSEKCTAERLRHLFKAADVIFGCTDDHSGRAFLNRISYFYNCPVFDMGIGIDSSNTGEGRVQSVDSRVTYIAPGSICQFCRKTIDSQIARDEELNYADPEEFRNRQREGYVNNIDVVEPAVGYITTSTACMAIDELVARLTGYRKSTQNRVRKFRLRKDTFPGASSTDCPICSSERFWGRGDCEPFLDRIG